MGKKAFFDQIHCADELSYRSDLDGLRAIAVWSVIFFHISHEILPGGYLGVDIFFVLSGYLITSILWRDSQQQKFSIVKFYDRRIRRIMPALITVLTFTTVMTAVLLLPSDLIGYGKSLLSSLAFVANIYFWRDTDYFAAAAATKPLLHLWTLSVEEQFYIFYPWLIVLLTRFRKSATLPTIAAIIVLSLLFDVVLNIKGGASPAFFLLPTRMWELGIGGFLAVLPANARLSRTLSQLLSLVGAILIGVSIMFPLIVPVPVPVSALTVFGTAFVLLAGNNSALPAVNKLLSTRPLVFFGLISYSLYLWHWPVIVLGQYYLVRNFTLLECIAALAFINAGAYLSWRYIERPFRSKSMPVVKVRTATAVGVTLLALVGVLLIWADGLPWRLNKQAAVINDAVGTNYRCAVQDYLLFGASRGCVLNLPSRNPQDADVVLLGNSHAQMYAPVVGDVLKERGLQGLLVPVNLCLPTIAANVSTECVAAAQRNLDDVVHLQRARTIIIAMTWGHDALVKADGTKVDNSDNKVLIEALDDLIARLHKSGKRVVLVGPIAEPYWNVASDVSRDLAYGHAIANPLYMPVEMFQARFAGLFAHFKDSADGIRLVRPDTVQCPAARCEYLLDGRSLFADSSHIARGELYRFRSVFEEGLRD